MTKSLNSVMTALPEERKQRVEARAMELAASITLTERKGKQSLPASHARNIAATEKSKAAKHR